MKLASKMSSFVIEKVGDAGGRLGTLKLNEEQFWRTPMFFVHTLTGSVPHLTSEVFDMLFSSGGEPLVPPIQISVDTFFQFHENVKPSGQTISRFVGLPKCASFLTVHDPSFDHPEGYNDKLGISIWPKHGRRSINNLKFTQIVNDFQPDFFQTLSDFDVNRLSSKKRIKKSTTRNLEFLNGAIENTDNSKSILFATIEAAWFLADPVEGHNTLSKYLEKQHALGGFVIDDFKTFNQPEVDEKVLNEILAKLPQDKPKYVSGELGFGQIVDLVSKGVDLFDSSIVTRLTGAGKAIVLPLDDFLPKAASIIPNESLPTKNSELSETEGKAEGAEETYLNLKDKRYFDDFDPILKNCDCYTCRRHTRSYVHHLIVTKELLASVLIMFHNLFQFNRFFEAIQHSITNEEKLSFLKLRTRQELFPPIEEPASIVSASENQSKRQLN